MLSYRHSFHAGNFADVLKHSVQSLIIESLQQKPKPFVYYDTHAGAGKYHLKDKMSVKTGEYQEGIAKIIKAQDLPELIKPYIDAVKSINDNELSHYLGSPLLASILMNKKSRFELCELHPTDFLLLQKTLNHCRNANIQKIDGYKALLAKLPPVQRRGFILIDPPYELKGEYDDVIKAIKQAHKKFSTGIYAIWYPVINRNAIEKYCKRFTLLNIKNILRIEHCVKADSDGYGMTGSGMIVINPPWKLASQMQQILPWLNNQLKQDHTAQFKIEQIVKE